MPDQKGRTERGNDGGIHFTKWGARVWRWGYGIQLIALAVIVVAAIVVSVTR